jgi:hypothetical protein
MPGHAHERNITQKPSMFAKLWSLLMIVLGVFLMLYTE